MKFKTTILFILFVMLSTNAQTPKHKALVISGDTPDSAKVKVERAIENGDTLEGLWGLQEALRKGSRAYDEFWNDNFLMWEILYNKDWADSVIQVFYGYGDDYETQNPNYRARKYNLEQITDCGAYKDSILGFLSDLCYGHPNAMGRNHILFFWVISHGSFGRFKTIDGELYDYELYDSTHTIYAKAKIFWMQQCRSGSFIDTLEGWPNIILTSCKFNQIAFACDDRDWDHSGDSLIYGVIENEYDSLTQKKYNHGEFDFHVMNAVRQKKIWPYDDPPLVLTADSNCNRGVSMSETFSYLCYNNSIYQWDSILESPQKSGNVNLMNNTYLEWDDLLPPAVPEGFIYSYKRDTDIEWGIDFLWNDNKEIDMSGYNIYRNGGFLDKTYKDTTYIDYDIDNYRGDTVQYGLSAFDLRDRESSEADLSFTIPITISDDSTSTAYNNARRLVSHQLSIYSLYLSNNRVYCIISDDNGETWGTPELVSDSLYNAKVPAGGKAGNGKIVAVWFRGNDKLMYSVRDNGVWGNPSQVSYPNSQIHSLRNLGIAVKRDTCHIFMYGTWRSDEELRGSRYSTKWYYGKFHINNPSPQWRTVATKSGMVTSSPTITLKNRTPLLAYDKDNEITYTQPVSGVWYK